MTGENGEPLLQRSSQMTDAERLQDAIALVAAAKERIAEAKAAGVAIDIEPEEIWWKSKAKMIFSR